MSQQRDTNAQDARIESATLNTQIAARQGAMERGELPTLREAALERAGVLALDCRFAESRRVLEISFHKGSN